MYWFINGVQYFLVQFLIPEEHFSEGQITSYWVKRCQKKKVNQRSADGLQTPLHAAAFSGQDKVLKKLLANGANKNATDVHGKI